MNILIATDSFKDALPALHVCKTIASAWKQAQPKHHCRIFPLADGGEGTSSIFLYHSQGKQISVQVHDPLFRKITAHYGVSEDEKTAFIEMATASGLELLSPDERNPLLTTSFGTGELIKDAIQKGVPKILLAIGGSATNDAGMGMAAALGYQFLDTNGQNLLPIGEHLNQVAQIIPPNTLFLPEIEVICDVKNPLFGPQGAAYVYAPQKGADAAMVRELDRGLRHFSKKLNKYFDNSFADLKGAGAAGGMGAGAAAFLDAKLKSGIDVVLDQVNFEEQLNWADLIITGEGKLDTQSLQGKLIAGITKRAKAKNVAVIALCGTLAASIEEIESLGLQAAFSIVNKPISLKEALTETENLLYQTAFQVARLFDIR